MVPVYTKPNTPKRRKRPGARKGHPGHRRPVPTRVDRRNTHRLKRCPCCGGPLQRCSRTRTRLIEDIPEEIEPVVTEHTIHRDYCAKCKKHVEPVVPDALPRATIGHHLIALTAWLHYGLGVTIDQIIDILSYHLQTELTPGGLIDAWRRLAEILLTWYEQIAEEAKNSAYLHADETGWRVNGQGCWLWCFTNDRNCYYTIEYCRGSPVLQKFFTEAFDGVLITDFWAAYDSVDAADRQKCIPHLLRELEKVDLRNDSAEWRAFAKKLRRLLRDGIRLRKRSDFTPERYQGRIDRLNRRIGEMARGEHADADARRLTKRLRRYPMFVSFVRKSLWNKRSVLSLSLHGVLRGLGEPFPVDWRVEVGDAQSVCYTPGVAAAAGHQASRPAVQVQLRKANRPHGCDRLGPAHFG
jgi:transposase